jgi:hypothetical protein
VGGACIPDIDINPLQGSDGACRFFSGTVRQVSLQTVDLFK